MYAGTTESRWTLYSREIIKSTVNQLMFRIQNYKTRWIPWTMQRNSMILKRQAVVGYPTFPASPWVFRVFAGWLPAIFACSLIHGNHLGHQETFLKTYLHRVNIRQLSLEIRKVQHQHHAIQCLWIQEGSPSEQMNRREPLRIFQFPHRVSQGNFSTWNPPYRAQGAYLQNCTVELPRNYFSEIHSDKFLDPSTFQCWKMSYVFDKPPAPNEPTASCPGDVYARSFWSTRCELFVSKPGEDVVQTLRN